MKPYLQQIREIVQARAAETGDLEEAIYLAIEGIKCLGDEAIDAKREALEAKLGEQAWGKPKDEQP